MSEEPPAVLVVEDEYYLAADIEEALTDAGFAIHDVVYSGEEALTLINGGTITYKALVTDVCLAGSVSGWDVSRRIREREPAFPVVYVTSTPAEEWASHQVPNSIVFPKPFVMARLVAAVATLINTRTSPAALAAPLHFANVACWPKDSGRGNLPIAGFAAYTRSYTRKWTGLLPKNISLRTRETLFNALLFLREST